MPRRIERRKHPRVEWNTPGRIRLHGDPVVTLPCVVHNLSNTGARITAPKIATLPAEFTLVLSSGAGKVRDCRVIWRSTADLGVEFVAAAPAAAKPRKAAQGRSG